MDDHDKNFALDKHNQGVKRSNRLSAKMFSVIIS